MSPVQAAEARASFVDSPRDATPLRVGVESGLSPQPTEAADGHSFAAVFGKTLEAASAKEREAVARAEALGAGRTDDLHGTMIAMKEADISLKLVGTIRNKLLDAFHELWRTSV